VATQIEDDEEDDPDELEGNNWSGTEGMKMIMFTE